MLHTQRMEDHGGAPWPAWVRCRARRWQVVDVHRLGASWQWQLAGPHDVPRLIASPPDVVTPTHVRERHVRRAGWGHAVADCVRQAAPAWWPASVAALPIDAIPSQLVPAMCILSGHHRRVLVADDVGMGKTVEAALLLHEVHARDPAARTLVVTPAHLLAQWAGELRARAGLEAMLLDAMALRREAVQPRVEVEAARGGACWLISIDLLRQPDVIPLVTSTAWTLLVVDEAHLAAPATARHTAVAQVSQTSARVMLLTATPHAAGPAGAEALRALGGRTDERPMLVLRRHASAGRPPRRSCVLRVRLSADHDALCDRLSRFAARARRDTGAGGMLPALVLLRRAASCPAALVRSLVRRLDVLGSAAAPHQPALAGFDDPETTIEDADAMDDEVMRLAAWSDPDAERVELEALLARARRLSPVGRKLAAVARFTRRCREPVVVFTSYVDTLRALRGCLPHRQVVVIHGGVPGEIRREAIEAFVRGEADVLLTTDAAAEGLNLHARCRIVVHVEVPWSARSFAQRTGRVDRYGQHRRVHAIVLTSGSEGDRRALERLRAGTDEGEGWLAAVTTPTRRRTDLAARWLERVMPDPEARVRAVAAMRGARVARGAACTAAGPSPGRRPDTPVRWRVRPGRWRRFTGHVSAPTWTTALCVGALRVSGEVPLATSVRAMVVATADDVAPPTQWREVVWRRMAPAIVRRGERVAEVIARWERDAGHASRSIMSDRSAPLLFADPRSVRLDAPPRITEAPVVQVRFDVWAIAERRR